MREEGSHKGHKENKGPEAGGESQKGEKGRKGKRGQTRMLPRFVGHGSVPSLSGCSKALDALFSSL